MSTAIQFQKLQCNTCEACVQARTHTKHDVLPLKPGEIYRLNDIYRNDYSLRRLRLYNKNYFTSHICVNDNNNSPAICMPQAAAMESWDSCNLYAPSGPWDDNATKIRFVNPLGVNLLYLGHNMNTYSCNSCNYVFLFCDNNNNTMGYLVFSTDTLARISYVVDLDMRKIFVTMS